MRCSFLELSEEQALRRCRLDRAAIAALCRELGADLQSLTGRSHALPVAVKVTSALAFLASGSFQTASRLSTGISQSAMSNCLAQFLAALQRRAPRYIAFPPPPAPPGDPPALPGVLGLVGAMHVALRAPADNEPLFRNAANFHSINMQVVCDRHGAITNVVAKFPGSCPNATVLENSALARLMEGSRAEGVWLLGEGGGGGGLRGFLGWGVTPEISAVVWLLGHGRVWELLGGLGRGILQIGELELGVAHGGHQARRGPGDQGGPWGCQEHGGDPSGGVGVSQHPNPTPPHRALHIPAAAWA